MTKPGRNDPCPCGSGKKYKKCCMNKEIPPIPEEVMEYFRNIPKEPFERGGFITGRPFIGTVFQNNRMRAVGNVIYKRPIDETFHQFLLRIFSELLTKDWFNKQIEKGRSHPISQWYLETEENIKNNYDKEKLFGSISGIKQTGNIRSLLSLAYDFYSLKHCGAMVLTKLLNRLKNEDEFQGARYEIAVGGLAARAGFQINWVNDKEKHCEFVGTHKITGDKVAFEAKSHHREGVLIDDKKTFDSENARIKISDHLRQAIKQKSPDIPLIIFDDLNLPITPGLPTNEKKWFKEVEEQLEKYGFFTSEEYKQCGALFVTNFSWHFHQEIPPDKNEVLTHFSLGNKFSLKQETINYLMIAAEQYGHVPNLLDEFKKENK